MKNEREKVINMKKVFEMLRIFCWVAIGMCIGGMLENGAIIGYCMFGIGLAYLCIIFLTIGIWDMDITPYYCNDTGEIVFGKMEKYKAIFHNKKHYNIWSKNWEIYRG